MNSNLIPSWWHASHFTAKYKPSVRDHYLLIRGIRSQVTLAPQSIPRIHSSDHEWLLRGQTLFSSGAVLCRWKTPAKRWSLTAENGKVLQTMVVCGLFFFFLARALAVNSSFTSWPTVNHSCPYRNYALQKGGKCS